MPDTLRPRYPGFKQETLTLKQGTICREGALELPCDIVFERDVPVALRDGVVMYTVVFRPVAEGSYPAIVAWSPYGKEVGVQLFDDVRRDGVALSSVSELQKFEGPDPAYWVNQRYVVLNPDARGAYASEGKITFWGRQLAEDGYDFIEWAGEQSLSNGKFGLSGNSWLAASQWYIAAEQPPHLAAIAPREGFSDLFREVSNPGGTPAPGFLEGILTTFAGYNFAEDLPRMAVDNVLVNDYWNDEVARLEDIVVPAHVVASCTNVLHTHGTFESYRRISSPEKWLRVHNSSEWSDYYDSAHVAELTSFFDKYLKGLDNDWASTPEVRISILDPRGGNTLDVVEEDWPVPGITPTTLYLADNSSLATGLSTVENIYTYNATASDGITLAYRMPETIDIISYMKLRLWVEASGSDDMELTVTVQKLDANGEAFTNTAGGESSSSIAATGKLEFRIARWMRSDLRTLSRSCCTPRRSCSKRARSCRSRLAFGPWPCASMRARLLPSALPSQQQG